MARHRFAPLIGLVAAGTAALLARLAQVQVLQHEVWAEEAADLMRTGEVVPFRRGDIFDARGRVVAYDERTYQVEFCYRDFRRDHPLGQVAHAASALLGRPFPLADALASLRPWAHALVRLTPAQLRDYAEGGGLECGPLRVPSARGNEETRPGRAADLAFYAGRLLGLGPSEMAGLRRLAREGGAGRAFVDLALELETVRERGFASRAELEAELEARLEAASRDLAQLAAALGRLADGEAASERGDLPGLLASLELWRARVEDGAASELFRQAAGFPAGRVETRSLVRFVDLSWLARLLAWDEARLERWAEASREAWLSWLERSHAPRLALEFALLRDEEAPFDPRPLLDSWAAPFLSRAGAASPSAAERLARGGAAGLRALAVFDQLESLLDVSLAAAARELPAPALPVQALPELEQGADAFLLLARAQAWAPAAQRPLSAGGGAAGDAAEETLGLAAAWREWAEPRQGGRRPFERAWLESASLAALRAWENHFQEALFRALEALSRSRGGPSGDGPEARPLALSPGRLERAEERARFVLKDHGSRPFVVARSPDYDLVYLLTRGSGRFAGFRVRERRDRARTMDPAPGPGRAARPLLGALLGEVRPPLLEHVVLERSLRDDFEDLRRKSARSPEEEQELYFLASRVDLRGAPRGLGGIEGSFDHLLRGHDGYREERGLQELLEKGRAALHLDRVVEDGADLALTVDLDLQRAALEVLEHPEADPDPSDRDEEWLARPAGAIVLLSVDGDVLAAASYPDYDRNGPELVDVHDEPLERTLRILDFQPPGSVWKPLVAAWALDREGLDPSATAPCLPLPDGKGAGYGAVHCSSILGHGEAIDLHEGLRRSCNSYFAWVGERCFDRESFAAMAEEFGFGRPTGARPPGRGGLVEHVAPHLFGPGFRERTRGHAANGLAVVEATPMQLARAYAGLASGTLPDVRFVRAAGEVELPRRSRPLKISREPRELVRQAMKAAACEPGGTSYDALNPREIGFEIAAKTGSADLVRTRAEGERVRKHAWFAGILPADEPRAVLVVFLHDTRATSSRSAIWVARQFLRSEALRAWLREQGVIE